jgi:LmbE family N-acetylglucosaminyl deacetylase
LTTATHLYISPHLDDVVLSVGGMISGQLRAGDRVVIGTVCTADPPAHGRLSPLANAIHNRWGNPRAPYAQRRQEDARACRCLGGAEYLHLGFHDAIYRTKPDRPEHRYEDFDELFGPIPGWDLAFSSEIHGALHELVARLSPSTILAPLGVGRNVDHLHVRNAVLGIPRPRNLGFYEEMPYAAGFYPSASADPVGIAVRTCPQRLTPRTYPIDWNIKLEAIQSYASQLTELFGTSREGVGVMAGYGCSLDASRRPMERVWYL